MQFVLILLEVPEDPLHAAIETIGPTGAKKNFSKKNRRRGPFLQIE
jgi:hypothetical protein